MLHRYEGEGSGLARRRRRVAELVAVAAILAAVAAASTWPLIRDLDRSRAGPMDADMLLNEYLILWGAHALTSAHDALPHTNMFHPARYTFAYSDMPLANTVLVYPVIALGGSPDRIFNVLLLASMVIGGLGVHVLARRLGLSAVAGAVAGILYAANPAHLARLKQLQLFTDHWLPWLLWAALAWMAACGLRRRTPSSWRRAAALALLVGVLFCAQALTGSHNAVFGALLLGTVVALHALGLACPGQGRPDRRCWIRLAVSAAVLVALVTAVVVPVFYPYAIVYDQLAEARLGDPLERVAHLREGSAGARELLSAGSRFWVRVDEVVGWPSAWISPERRLRAHLFPGVLFVVLAIAGMWPLRPRRGVPLRTLAVWALDVTMLGLAFLALVAAVSGRYDPLLRRLSPRLVTAFIYPLGGALALLARSRLGEGVPWVGVTETSGLARRWEGWPNRMLLAALALLCVTAAAGPAGGVYRILQMLPGPGLIRVPSRFVLPALVPLAILGGYGLEGIRRRLGRGAALLLPVLLLLFAYEGRLAPLSVGPPPYPPDALTGWLADQPGDFAILEVPVSTEPPAEVRQLIRSTVHWKKLLVGYSGSAPPGYEEQMAWLDRRFPDPPMLARLRQLGVRYVIVNETRLDPGRAGAARESPGLAPEVRFGSRVVYRVLDTTPKPRR